MPHSRRRWYTSLKAKVTLLIMILSLGGLGFLVVMFIAMEWSTLSDFEDEKVAFVENFVRRTLTPIMVTGQAAEVMPTLVENYKHLANMEDVAIIRTDGEEAFRDGKTIDAVNNYFSEGEFHRDNVQPARRIVPPDDPRLRQVLDTGTRMVYSDRTPDGTEIKHIMVPISNEEVCHVCHGSEHRIRGILLASFTMEKVERKITHDIVLLAIIAFAAVFLMSSAMFFFFNRIVVNPATNIVGRVRELVDTERFDTRIAETSNDELGDLTKVLNYFIGSVESSRKRQAAEKDRLEQAVQERTKELKEKTDFIESDLKLAQRIQNRLLPERFPDIPGVTFDAAYLPCLYIGGDYYDVFEMPNRHVGVFMADASGHGSSAALLVSIVKALMSTIGKDINSPGYVIQLINRTLAQLTPDDAFVTLFYGILNLDTGTMVYSLAGHPSPYIYNRNTGDLAVLEPNGGLVGVFADDIFADDHYECAKGDTILVYTDGILEATNVKKEQFGKERLIAVLQENASGGCRAVKETLLAEVDKFKGDAVLIDDVTIVLVDYDVNK